MIKCWIALTWLLIAAVSLTTGAVASRIYGWTYIDWVWATAALLVSVVSCIVLRKRLGTTAYFGESSAMKEGPRISSVMRQCVFAIPLVLVLIPPLHLMPNPFIVPHMLAILVVCVWCGKLMFTATQCAFRFARMLSKADKWLLLVAAINVGLFLGYRCNMPQLVSTKYGYQRVDVTN